jgi:hypothetical protein
MGRDVRQRLEIAFVPLGLHLALPLSKATQPALEQDGGFFRSC